jgi:DNA-directed RNA polymerase subunit RPC12/RpoP
MITKASCNKCGGHLEYNSNLIGTPMDCPHCGQRIILGVSAPPPSPVEQTKAHQELQRRIEFKEDIEAAILKALNKNQKQLYRDIQWGVFTATIMAWLIIGFAVFMLLGLLRVFHL